MTALVLVGAGGVVGPSLSAEARHRGYVVYGYRRAASGDALALDEPSRIAFPAARQAILTGPIWVSAAYVPALARAGVTHAVALSSTSLFARHTSISSQDRDISLSFIKGEESFTELCARHGVRASILRPTLIYGYGRDANIARAARFISRRGFFPIAHDGRGLRQPIHVDEVAQACLAALDLDRSVTFDIGGGETLSYRAMIERVFRVLGRKPIFIPMDAALPLLRLGGRVAPRLADITALFDRMAQNLNYSHDDWHIRLGVKARPFLSGGRADLFSEGLL